VRLLKDVVSSADDRAMAGARILEPATLTGLGVVALWLYVRFPRLRPRTIKHAMAHVAVSFGLFALLPYVVDIFTASLPKVVAILVFFVLVMLPVLTYVLFSWIALIAKIHELADSTPRGGHRVPERA
jgi:hypothetical protein